MIDPEGEIADALRTLWIWLLIGPAVQPLVMLLPELGFALGVTVPDWSGIVVVGLIAGVLVGVGERRYGRLVLAALLTLVLWVGATHVFGLTETGVYGTPRLVLAKLLLWISAVSLAIAVVFYTDVGISGIFSGDDPDTVRD